jgi:hypothetical protein
MLTHEATHGDLEIVEEDDVPARSTANSSSQSPANFSSRVGVEWVGPRWSRRPIIRTGLLVAGLVVMVVGILVVRGWRPTSDDGSSSSATMPISAEIEATYGVRFTGVDVTAGGGMIQIRYQVIDSDKTAAIHDSDGAPYIVDSNGHTYADPGMAGHSHVGGTKPSGTSDYVLLANARGGVKAGSVVTIRIGDLELRNVHVL